MTLRLLRRVEDELAQQIDYYEGERSGLGREFIERFAAAMEQAVRFPRSGTRVTHPGYAIEVRRFRLSRFPFHLFVAVHADELVVLAVAHHRRRPGYWSDRLGEV